MNGIIKLKAVKGIRITEKTNTNNKFPLSLNGAEGSYSCPCFAALAHSSTNMAPSINSLVNGPIKFRI